MTPYCLDSNNFIEAKDGPYSFEIAPGFWSWLEKSSRKGLICSPMKVHDELLEQDDELSEWAKMMKSKGLLFVEADEKVQAAFRPIADFVVRSYESHRSGPFLAKADPWLIAHAKAGSYSVVTRETLAPADSRKIKIPNICAKFGVECFGLYAMLREHGMVLK